MESSADSLTSYCGQFTEGRGFVLGELAVLEALSISQQPSGQTLQSNLSQETRVYDGFKGLYMVYALRK